MTAPTSSLSKTSSVQGVAIRVTRLDTNGHPVSGDDGSYILNRFVTLTFTPNYDGANNIQQQNADGSFAVTYNTPDVFQYVECTLQISGPQPEFNEIASGGEILTDTDGDSNEIVVGWSPTATGAIDQPNGCALEIWSLAVHGGRKAADRPYYHWMFPRMYLHPDDDRTVENDVMAWSFAGWGNGNENYDGSLNGSHNWKWNTNKPYQYARVMDAPLDTNDYETVG